MAYTTTYSSMLSDQEDLLNQYLSFDSEADSANTYNPDYDEAEQPEEEAEEANTPDDYEFYKNYYDENEARNSLADPEEDMSFLDFIFGDDNKYKPITGESSYGATMGKTSSPVTRYAGHVSESFKDSISKRESGGNYQAKSPNSSARGKYQFIWSIHKNEIAKQTGAKTEQEFMNSPQAQEDYFNYWDRTTLTPSANANYERFKQYYPDASLDDVKRATHFAGRGGLEKALKTGNFTKGIDANNTSIQKYVYGK